MKKILVGQYEQVLGTVGVTAQGTWVLEPLNATADELQSVVERVFARVRRRNKTLSRQQFVQQFFARGGPPATVYATSAWGKVYMPPATQTLIQRLLPATDPSLVALRRHDQEVLARIQLLQRA